MSGSKEQGQVLKQTMIEKYGSEEAFKLHMRTIGAEGGKVKGPGGFGSDRELARRVGAIGGQKSRRGKAKPV